MSWLETTCVALTCSAIGLGCGIYRPPSEHGEPAPTSPPTAGEETERHVDDESRADAPTAQTLHVAVYDGSNLLECADTVLEPIPPHPMPEGWEPTSLEDFYSEVGVPNRWVRLDRPCEQEIADQRAFGRCELVIDVVRDDGTRLVGSSSVGYYGLGVVERDRRPSECESRGGQWEWLE